MIIIHLYNIFQLLVHWFSTSINVCIQNGWRVKNNPSCHGNKYKDADIHQQHNIPKPEGKLTLKRKPLEGGDQEEVLLS